ncbi:MAG: site-specific integrase, partial [Sphingomonadaceae bacterium]|nr:site-specific integrase [Sphingomonadaceae bacterium]
IVLDKGAPIAREVRKHLAGMFSWAAARGLVRVSPLTGLRRKDLRYTTRERFLSMDELGRIWDAAGDLGYPFGDWYRLLVLTGQRRSEIAGLRRDWFDNDSERLFVIPAEQYKTAIEQTVPLSAPAWRLIKTLPKWNEGPFLFSTTSGLRPVSGFSKARIALDKKMLDRAARDELPPIEPWAVHDIRRSVATHMARIGILPEHVERVLGHKVGGVAGIYNRHGYLDEKRAAMEMWGKLWT